MNIGGKAARPTDTIVVENAKAELAVVERGRYRAVVKPVQFPLFFKSNLTHTPLPY